MINDCLISTLRLGQKGKGSLTVLTVATIFIDAILYQNDIICTPWKVLRAQFDSLSTDSNLLSKRLGEEKKTKEKKNTTSRLLCTYKNATSSQVAYLGSHFSSYRKNL